MSIESMMPSNHLVLCAPFSSCPQSFQASGSLPMTQLLTSDGQSCTSTLSSNTTSSWYKTPLCGILWEDWLAGPTVPPVPSQRKARLGEGRHWFYESSIQEDKLFLLTFISMGQERDFLFTFQKPLKHLEWDGAAFLGHPGECVWIRWH